MKRTKRNALLSVCLTFVVVLFLSGCQTVKRDSSVEAPIGIISAMKSEMALLLENAEIAHTDTIGGVEYHVGTLEGKPVVLVKAGVGKINAAAGTATLINCYGVKAILFTGVAGAVRDEIKVTDIVVSTRVLVHDYGQVTNDGFVWGPNSGTEDGSVPADPDLVRQACDAAVAVVGKDHVFAGTVVTGDQFVASRNYVETLQKEFDGYATEMEGAAVGLVAHSYQTPFVVIRSMSDKADGEAHESYANFGKIAADHSAHIIMELVRTL